MKLKEITECEDCPLRDGYCNYKSYDDYHICQDENYLNMEIDDIKKEIASRINRYEKAEDKRLKIQQEKDEKKQELKNKRRKTYLNNYEENKEIARLKKIIKQLNEYKQYYESRKALEVAMGRPIFGNAIDTDKVDLEINNMEQRIKEVQAYKKLKGK